MKRIALLGAFASAALAAVQVPVIDKVVNSAGPTTIVTTWPSPSPYNAFAQGSLITIYGRNLATATAVATTYPWPTTLAGTSVTISNATASATPCRILYASPTQVNVLLPNDVGLSPEALKPGNGGLGPFGSHDLFISTPAGTMGMHGFTIAIAQIAPGLFFGDSRLASALHAISYQVVTASNPVSPDEYVSLYATGLGELRKLPPEELATAITVKIDGLPASVLWVGRAPGFDGLDQINVQIPAKVQRKTNVMVDLSYTAKMTWAANSVWLPIN
jgi:uncharacterized protein (TIGR03437 family)